jgi:hypothetical protein
MKLGYYVWIMAGTSEAYIQPAPYRTVETVNTAPHSHIRLVYELQATNLRSGLCTVSPGGGVAHAGGAALLTRLLTNMRLIAVNWGMLY